MIPKNYVPPLPSTPRTSSAADQVAFGTQYKGWHYETLAKKAVENLKRHFFGASYVPNRQEAFEKIMAMIPDGATVGLADSMTMYQIGVIEALEKGDYNFINPWREGVGWPDEHNDLCRQVLLSDILVTGTNAITLSGELVNIDGLGNRVAAQIFGPKKVVIAAGANKIVNNVDEAIKRIREYSVPNSVVRHGYEDKIPCGKSGRCHDCNTVMRVCRCVTIIERDIEARWGRPPRINVVIIGEELGL